MPFPEFMAAALYDPARGYYARETRQVGRKGDFFTSVSVGPVFGMLLAERFLLWWWQAGSPPHWRILECGAHDGTLAADVLRALQSRSPEALEGLDYVIAEPLPSLAAAQRETLKLFPQARVISALDSLEPLPGILFGNELLDALPFVPLTWRSGQWVERRVALEDGRFTWQEGPAWGEFPTPPAPLPDSYQTEVRSNYVGFFEPRLATLSSGLMLWIDYGFARADYLAPERTTGTLRTFSRHRAGENPLADPGEVDITAHVDFTAAAEAARSLGGIPSEFANQGAWLTHLAAPWLRSMEAKPDPALLRQFLTLTHPAHLGARFQVLEVTFGGEVSSAAIERTGRRLGLP